MSRWNLFTTADKMRIARVLYRALSSTRKLVRKPETVVTKRRGVTFELDLAEGIDLAMYLFAVFEADTHRALRRLVRPGDIVLDIGANSGVHTLPIARMAGQRGRVVAFEPTRIAFDRLRRNIELNPDLGGRVTPVMAYLTDKEHGSPVPAFYASWRLDVATARHPKHSGSLAGAAEALALTLDGYVKDAGIEKIDLIKIDVDGYECRVIRGAEATLKRDRPRLIIEVCPYALEEQGDSAEALLGLLTAHGYSFFEERHLKRVTSDPQRIKASIRADSSINLIALA